ncbi:MAG: Hsp20/alpha crystallin family protein [Candidatus Krumholzibacteriia bacterium]
MKHRDRMSDLEEIFEILVSSYGQRGGAMPAEGELCWRPATDAYETEDSFVVQMDLAGIDPAQIEVVTDGDALLVRGIRQDVNGPGKKHFHKMEINVGPFVRRIPIGIEVDPDSAVARYRGGFLYVTFRKGRTRQSVRRRVQIDS